MDSAISHLARNARLCGIITPADPRVFSIIPGGMVAMAEIGDNAPDSTQLTRRDHRPHLPHHRISAVAVIDCTGFATGLCRPNDVFAFFDGHGHRLFAKHVKPGLKKCLGDLIMGAVRGGDRHQIDPVGAIGLTFEHRLPTAISPIGRHPQRLGVGTALGRIDIQRPGNKGKMPIGLRAKTVCRPDLAALTAADHPPVQFLHGPSPVSEIR